MEPFTLTPAEVAALRQTHRQMRTRTADAYRLNAIILLGTGWTQQAVSEALLLDDRTLRRYVAAYRQSGIDGLLESHCRGSVCRLNDDQLAQLDEHLQDTLYTDTRDVRNYIQHTFGVTYSVSGVTHLLKRLDYVYKKPKHIPGKADRQAQEAFLAEYETLKSSKTPEEPIYFMDAVHPQHNSMPACGWIKKGTEFPLQANCGRQRLNINGAVDVTNLKVVTRMDQTINAQSTIALLKQIEKKHPGDYPIHIIADNARYYRSVAVKEYLAEHRRMDLISLPAYSPNLNLIERLWKYFRKTVLYNQYYEKFSEYTQAAQDFFKNIRSHRKKLATLLTENFHLYPE